MAKYLSWVKEFTPKIKEGERKEISKVLSKYIDKKEDQEVRVRKYERYMRIAMAIARLNRRNVEAEDVVRAIDLVKWRRVAK